MKKVVVVTWYKSDNYGTCLQAYALTRYLTNKGFDSKLLAYGRYYGLNEVPAIIKKVKEKLKKKLNTLKKYESKPSRFLVNSQKVYNKNFQLLSQDIRFAYMNNYQSYRKLQKETDAFIVGGDQLWNPDMLATTYFLPFVKDNNKKFAFGTSFGVEKIPLDKIKIYKKGLRKFKQIACRENSGANLVYKIAKRKADVVLDPVFLLTKLEWVDFFEKNLETEKNQESPYIICYFVGGVQKHYKLIKKLADEKNLVILGIPMCECDYEEYENIIETASMTDFLSLIYHATYVMTDSFHATAFSIIFEKEFYNFHRFQQTDEKSQNSRLDQLLNRLGIKSRYLDEKASISELQNLNYKNINIYVTKECEKSKEILEKMLQENN